MKPTIITKNAFTVVGLQIETTATKMQTEIDQLWRRADELDLDNTIRNRADMNLTLAFVRNWSEQKPFTYFLGAEVDSPEDVPTDCVVHSVPTLTYAVFDLLGTGSNLIEPWPEIMAWFEQSEYAWTLPMNFREYDSSTEGGRIFIPI